MDRSMSRANKRRHTYLQVQKRGPTVSTNESNFLRLLEFWHAAVH